MYNSTIRNKPPEGKECFHVTCGATCRRPKKEPKPRKPIAKVSAKRKAGWFDAKNTDGGEPKYIEMDEAIFLPKESKGTAELQRWFEERRKELKGVCKHCGGRTCTDDKYYKFSIAHILPKKLFKSITTHPLNFIELCFWSPSCHTNFDNFTLDITDLNCFDEVIEKVVSMYPGIDKKERRLIPKALLQYIETET